jgi:hypothetical protein
VLGVSDTPAWQAILAATTTGTVVGAVITQGFTIWKSRIEADNQRKQAYEGRAWNAKHAALKRLVTACRSVRFRADEQPNDADFRRGATVKGLEMFRDEIGGDDGIGEVVLYADPQVEAKLDELLHMADTVPAKFPDQLVEVERIGDALYGLGKESLTPEQRVARRKELDADRDEAFTKLGVASKSDLNVEKVFRLCEDLIDLAKQDLQGAVTPRGVGVWTVAAVLVVAWVIALLVALWAHPVGRVTNYGASALLVFAVFVLSGPVVLGTRYLWRRL